MVFSICQSEISKSHKRFVAHISYLKVSEISDYIKPTHYKTWNSLAENEKKPLNQIAAFFLGSLKCKMFYSDIKLIVKMFYFKICIALNWFYNYKVIR